MSPEQAAAAISKFHRPPTLVPGGDHDFRSLEASRPSSGRSPATFACLRLPDMLRDPRHVLAGELRVMRVLQAAAVAVALAGCTSTLPPVEQHDYKSRSVTRTEGGVRVSTAV